MKVIMRFQMLSLSGVGLASQILAIGALSAGFSLLASAQPAAAQNCNPFGCSQPGAGPCNPFGCPSPGAAPCTPFGCPAAPSPPPVQQQPQPQDPVIYQPQPQSQGNTTTNARRMLRVDNNTGIEVMSLYLSPSSSRDWGGDVLGSGTLNSGYYMQFTLNTAECMYDIKAELPDGQVIQGQFDSCRYTAYVLR